MHGETDTGEGLRFVSAPATLDLPRPALPGAHQTPNAGMAIAAMLELRDQGFDIPDSAIAEGLTNAVWPARMQRLTRGPIIDALGEDWEVWLDGGHNAAAGAAIAEMVRNWDDKPLHIVFGMLNTKAAGDFLAPIAPHVASARAIAIPGEENSLSAEEAAAFAQDAGISCTPFHSIREAVAALPTGPARLLICGSLYLAGTILADNQ